MIPTDIEKLPTPLADALVKYGHDEPTIVQLTEHARRLERDRAALIEALEIGIYDGRLQTFEDRERFRKEARETLAAVKERK